MYPRCCRINFGFYSSTPVDKEPKFLKINSIAKNRQFVDSIIIK